MNDIYPSPGPKPGIDTLYTLKRDYRLPFGIMRARKVSDLLSWGPKWKNYLGWLYFNSENISFSTDILEELGIAPIDKPGTNLEAYKEWETKNDQTMNEEELNAKNKVIMGAISHKEAVKRKHNKRKEIRTDRIEKKFQSAAALAWYNQGHRKKQ